LIGNAIKYSRQKDNPEIKIWCRKIPAAELNIFAASKAGGSYYHVAIEDNGIGFGQEYADRIFNVFTRLHGNSEYTGTGVGLAIVKKVMDHHDGFVTAEGRPDEGAVFNLYFPANDHA
jgi:signal transduction histidine kinase